MEITLFKYVSDPFIAFFAGLALIYTVLVLIDSISCTLTKRRMADIDTEFSKYVSDEQDAEVGEPAEAEGNLEQVDYMQAELDEHIRMYEELLGEQYRERDVLKDDITELRQTNADLETRLQESADRESVLKQDNAESRNTIQTMRSEHEQAAAALEERISKLEKKYRILQTETDNTISGLREENEKLSSSLQKAGSKLDSLEKEAESFKNILEKDRAEHKKETDELHGSVQMLEKEKEELEHKNSTLSENLQKARSEKEDFEEQSSSLSQEMESLKQETVKHEAALESQYREKIDSLEQDLKSMESDLQKVQEKCSLLEEEAGQLRGREADAESLEKLERKVMSLEVENASLKTDLAKSVPKEEFDIMRDKNDILTSEVNKYKMICIQFQDQLGQYRGNETVEDPSLKVQHDPVTKTLYEENKQLSAKVDEYLSTISSLKLDIEELLSVREENKKLKQEIDGRKRLPEKPADTKKGGKSSKKKKKKNGEKGNGKEKKKGKKEKKPEKAAESAGESVDLVLSDKDLLEEIEEPSPPKTDEVPDIVAKSSKREDNKEEIGRNEGEKKEEDHNLYNIFLPKLTTREKKEKAIPLIQDISGISKKEAEELVKKTVIPVAKGITREKAEEMKERFMDNGILPRIREQV